MCVNLREVTIGGRTRLSPCRKCWQCKSNRVNDLVGRCIAESRFTAKTSVVTLTYGTSNTVGSGGLDTMSAVILNYEDVQRYFKRLRRDGFAFRYVVAGEYGERKGRAHWHAIMFWKDRVPPHPAFDGPEKGKWWHDPHWTKHPDSAGGYSHWGEFTRDSARYVCKYLVKAEDDERTQRTVRWSKNPLLGAEFFRELASRYVKQRLLPRDRFYSFADHIDARTGKPRQFYMNDAATSYFLRCFCELWELRYGTHPLDENHTDLVHGFYEASGRRLTSDLLERREYVPAPKWDPVSVDGEVYPWEFDELRNCYVARCDGVEKFWSFDRWGNLTWCDAIGRRKESEASRIAHAEASSSSPPRLTSERYRRESNGA